MNDWFIWNGIRCTEYGIHVLEQPPLTIPSERATFTNVPGRSGTLTTLEGDDVYDDMVLTATCIISDPSRISGARCLCLVDTPDAVKSPLPTGRVDFSMPG